MKTLVLANQKGGVGKSAVATLLAQYFVKTNLRVIAVDLDHQGNTTKAIASSQRACVAEAKSDALLATMSAAVPRERFVLVPAAQALVFLERQASLHNAFAQNFRAFLQSVGERFDVCVVDTHPNPDIRMVAALISADFVLSPIQLNDEAIQGVQALYLDPRAGIPNIKARLNPKLQLIGLLPTQVEATPFQKKNFKLLIEKYFSLLIRMGPDGNKLASIPKRSAIAEAQGDGQLLWEMKKTAARDAWLEIEPVLHHLAGVVMQKGAGHGV
jgi:chromosome partitioning protein